jgi:mRNA-degrading endonuclease RelE of RelBE toxin-antitoxin system
LTSTLAEFIDAMNYLDARRQGLGSELRDEVDRAIELIQRKPDTWPLITDNIRRYRLRRFSFFIIYELLDDTLNIVAIMHTRRRPGYWKDRR